MMRGFMTLIALAGLLLVGNAMLDNTSQPIQAEAPSLPLPIVETSPSDKYCGDACDCCDRCPCNASPEPAVEVVAEVAKPAPKQTPAAYSVGDDIRTASGALHTVTKVSVIGGKWAYHTQPKSVSVNVFTPISYASGYYDGTSQWTYPGDIRSHLAGTHGQANLSGMSKDQMESLHDSLHNGTQAVRQPVRMPKSNCPGGVCPQPRRSLFRW